jgi:hypothetical protein
VHAFPSALALSLIPGLPLHRREPTKKVPSVSKMINRVFAQPSRLSCKHEQNLTNNQQIQPTDRGNVAVADTAVDAVAETSQEPAEAV